MTLSSRIDYYRRIGAAYLTPLASHLDFWHEPPEVNPRAQYGALGEYYMTFARKADYGGRYDERGVPLLNYRGAIGWQYNPIAIAQYGLGNYNLFQTTLDPAREAKFLQAADWLLSNQERNAAGLSVWNHHFDWEYRTRLKAPWYSALAQGQGVSLLVRAHQATGDRRYLAAATRAVEAFLVPTGEGGVTFEDDWGNTWFEEYITSPPTHILNGFVWATWGVFDYFLATSSAVAKELLAKAIGSLARNLKDYDTGFWSLYERPGARGRMLASPFYHSLHITQLAVLHAWTGERLFRQFAERWDGYRRNRGNRARALAEKSFFKLCHY